MWFEFELASFPGIQEGALYSHTYDENYKLLDQNNDASKEADVSQQWNSSKMNK